MEGTEDHEIDEIGAHIPVDSPSAEFPRSEPAQTQSEAALLKIELIEIACRAGDRETVVRQAVTTDGLVGDDVRRKAWPLLLGYATPSLAHDELDARYCGLASKGVRQAWKKLPPHPDEGQVELDVNRSFIYYPTNISRAGLEERRKQLSDLIVEVLRRHPLLAYFQGFHDICQVLLLVLGPEGAVYAAEHIALLRIRDFMLPSMSPALDHLRLLYPLLSALDPKLHAHLSNTQPFFALAATLTLYAHDIQEYGNIVRLFDAFLAMGPIFPLYLFGQIVLERSEELLDIPDDEPEILHSVLSKLPKPLDFERLILHTVELLNREPPAKLSTWKHISSISVLKSPAHMSLVDAESLLVKQCALLARRKRRKEFREAIIRRRKPLLMGLSVLVALTSITFGYYGRRHGLEFSHFQSLRRLIWSLLR